MRTLVLFFATFFAVQTFAQAPPQAFSYSGIARENGQIVANTQIGLELSIIEGIPTGTNVYTETQTTTTDTAGYFSVAVGFGTPTNGIFSNINWGNGNHYLNVGADFSGGNNYTNLGTTQLLSVPYALSAGSITEDYIEGYYSVSITDTMSYIRVDNPSGDTSYYNGLSSTYGVGYIKKIGNNYLLFNSSNAMLAGVLFSISGSDITVTDIYRPDYVFQSSRGAMVNGVLSNINIVATNVVTNTGSRVYYYTHKYAINLTRF